MDLRRSLAAARRPLEMISKRRDPSRPSPWPNPCQVGSVMVRAISGASGQRGTSTRTITTPRSRALADNLRASPGRALLPGSRSSRSTPSRREATTTAHFSSGEGTRTRWSRRTPSSLAATRPSEGRPTAATHPVRLTSPARRRAREVPPETGPTAMVLPLRIPPSGKRGRRAAGTSTSCASAELAGCPRLAAIRRECIETPIACDVNRTYVRFSSDCRLAPAAGARGLSIPSSTYANGAPCLCGKWHIMFRQTEGGVRARSAADPRGIGSDRPCSERRVPGLAQNVGFRAPVSWTIRVHGSRTPVHRFEDRPG